MLDASKETAIYLNKFIDTSLFDNYGGEVVMNLFFKNCNSYFFKQLFNNQ